MAATKTPPGPGGDLQQQALEWNRDPFGFLTRCAREYGDVVRLPAPRETWYMLNHPDDIHYVLRTHHRSFRSRVRIARSSATVFGKGLLLSEGDVWRSQRQLAQPAFQFQQVRSYGPLMVAYTRQMLETWLTGETRDVYQDLMGLTLPIAPKALFAVDVDDELREAVDQLVPGSPRFGDALRRLNELTYRLIRTRRAGGAEGSDLLSRSVNARHEDGSPLTDQEVRDEFITLLLVGRDPTALAVSYSFYLLAQHGEAEARLWAELDEVLAGRDPTAEDLPSLPYTERVVLESMRLYPPIWSIDREALGDCEIGGYPVAKGTHLLMSQWVVHRDPRWYAAAESFRPERWQDDLAKRLPRCAYFPFADGPRACIGDEFAMTAVVLILATIAQRYRLALAPKQTIQFFPAITLKPVSGIKMVLHDRCGPSPGDFPGSRVDLS